MPVKNRRQLAESVERMLSALLTGVITVGPDDPNALMRQPAASEHSRVLDGRRNVHIWEWVLRKTGVLGDRLGAVNRHSATCSVSLKPLHCRDLRGV